MSLGTAAIPVKRDGVEDLVSPHHLVTFAFRAYTDVHRPESRHDPGIFPAWG